MRRYTLAQITDSHFDHTSRWQETCEIHEWIADELERRRPDLILHTGDVYERPSVPSERIHVAGWFQRLAAIAPVLIVRGNHDALVDLEIFRKLETEHPLYVEEACGSHLMPPFAVAAVAWPRKAHLLATAGRALKPLEEAELAAQAIRNVIGGLGVRLGEWAHGPRILAAHAMVRGSKTSKGQPLVGCDMEIGIEDLALAGADFVALGHIHMGQEWMFNGAPIVYGGSPRRTEYGELEDKGFIWAEFGDEPFDVTHSDGTVHASMRGPRWFYDWERVLTPARPMLLLEASWDGVGLTPSSPLPDVVANAEIRLRYETAKDQRVSAKAAVALLKERLLAGGAHSVKPEERVHASTRSRAPELTKAQTLPEKLDVYWRVKGIEVAPARRERLFQKLAELDMLEEEAS